MNCKTNYIDMIEAENASNNELAENDAYEGRCGEIFITEKRFIIFHCTFCDDVKYSSIEAFLEHLSDQHYNQDDINQKENTCKDDNEDEIIEVDLENATEEISMTSEDVEEEFHDLEHLDIQESDVIEDTLFNAPSNDDKEVTDVESYIQHGSSDEAESVSETYLEITPIPIQKPQDAKNNDSAGESKSEKCVPNSRKSASLSKAKSTMSNCTLCKREFPNTQKYRAHMRSHSNTERKFKCDICGFAFKETYNLRAHMRRHTNKKQFSCPICSKQFFTRNELSVHERRHTGERPFICSHCGQAFISSGSLNEHVKRHNNYRPHKCLICDKSFYDTYQLKEHQIVHTQERSHRCAVCNASFSRRKSLMVHMKLHANMREYICQICEAAFNQKQALTMHIKNKHKAINVVVNSKSRKKQVVMEDDEEEDMEAESEEQQELLEAVQSISVCTHCEMNFVDVEELLEHEQNVHTKVI